MRRFPDARRIALHAGGGANGGDGRIAAEILRAQGRELVDERPDVVIDALLGTGLKGAPREETSQLIEQINAAGVPVLAVDIPSGVNASTGEVAGAAVRADVTVTMHGPKVGLAVAPGRFHAGEVAVADIGLEAAETEHRLVTPEILAEVPRRSPRDNKYTAGHVLVVGGSRGMTGAPALAARAALPRRRRLRDDRRAGRVAPGSRDARAGGGEAAARGGLRRRRRRRRRSRSVRASGASRRRRRSSAACSRRSSCRRSSTPTRSSSSSPASGRRRACSPRTRASSRACSGASRRRSQRTGSRRCRRRRSGSSCVVVLKGEDSLVAAPGRGVLVCALGLPSLSTAGHGRRPHRHHGRLPREGDGAAAGGRRSLRGAAARLARSRRSATASSRAT